MAQRTQSLEDMIRELPPELEQEVRDFVRHLLDTKAGKKRKFLRQDWAGALAEYRDQYTALQLKKKALDWWSE